MGVSQQRCFTRADTLIEPGSYCHTHTSTGNMMWGSRTKGGLERISIQFIFNEINTKTYTAVKETVQERRPSVSIAGVFTSHVFCLFVCLKQNSGTVK